MGPIERRLINLRITLGAQLLDRVDRIMERQYQSLRVSASQSYVLTGQSCDSSNEDSFTSSRLNKPSAHGATTFGKSELTLTKSTYMPDYRLLDTKIGSMPYRPTLTFRLRKVHV